MSMLPSPSELGYFIEVANTQNISRAAERLGIAQPTLSLAIQRLEQNFGAPLLVRNRSGVKLTPIGRRLLSQSKNLLMEWDRVRSESLKDENELTGSYIIGAHPSVALYCLPSLLPDLLQKFVHVEIKLVHDLSRRICEQVISFEIDFGIVVNPWNHPDLVLKPLSRDEVTLWVGPKKTPLNEVNSDRKVLICDPDLIQTQSILKQLEKFSISFDRVLYSSNLEVITSLVAAGAGVGVLPGRVALRDSHLKLQIFKKDGPKFFDRCSLVYRADAQRSKTSRTIARFIESQVVWET